MLSVNSSVFLIIFLENHQKNVSRIADLMKSLIQMLTRSTLVPL